MKRSFIAFKPNVNYFRLKNNFNRKYLILIHDLAACFFSLPLTLWLRVGNDFYKYSSALIFKHTVIYTLFSAGILIGLKTYSSVWRYVSMKELMLLALSVTFIECLYSIASYILSPLGNLPRSLIIINWFINLFLLGSSRFIYRLLKNEMIRPSSFSSHRKKIILIGLTDHTELFIRDQKRHSQNSYEIVGIVDLLNAHAGRNVHSIEVLGEIKDFLSIIKKLHNVDKFPEKAVICDLEFTGKPLQELMELNKKNNIETARLPHAWEFSSPQQKITIRPISIEDLLGRPEVDLDRASMQAFFQNKRIMITGCGGSIGGELVRQINTFNPSHLILLDHSEYMLYQCELEMKENFPQLSRRVVLADVTNLNLIEDIVKSEKPEIIFHAAALKHVPLAESNPNQAILTNVMGTQNIAETARQHNVKAVIFISTDKAVNPTGIMGATKRLSESYCQALDAVGVKEGSTRFITTRFGNVLGSTGSVVPLFERQIARGGPLTVTHPDVKRYFMTIHEAVELVLQATVVGFESPETAGQIFVLEMGNPVKIKDLAYQMIELAGLIPDKDIKIKYTGLREGEKLCEELFYGEEKLLKTKCKGLLLAFPPFMDYQKLKNSMEQLFQCTQKNQTVLSLKTLKKLVPDYNPHIDKKVI